MERNPGVQFDASWFQDIKINFPGVKLRAETIGKRRSIKKDWQAAWLLRAVTCMDLTTLSGKKNFTRLNEVSTSKETHIHLANHAM